MWFAASVGALCLTVSQAIRNEDQEMKVNCKNVGPDRTPDQNDDR